MWRNKAIKKDFNNLLSKSREFYLNKIEDKYKSFNFNVYRSVVLFGAADMGAMYIDLCQKNDIKVIKVCDNDRSKQGKILKGIKIIPPEHLSAHYPKDVPVIITSIYEDEIKKQLYNLGFFNVWSFMYFAIFFPHRFNNPHWLNSIDPILIHKKEILSCFELLEDEMSQETYLNVIKYRLLLKRSILKKIVRPASEEYFDTTVLNLTRVESESYVDGGAYLGDTILKFIKATNNSFDKIYAFEPDMILFKKLSEITKKLHDKRIRIFRYGLGRREGVVKFSNERALGSRINALGSATIKVISLDTFMPKGNVTLIKLDIEGSEKDALLGMRKTIIGNKPKLAICIYHKPNDLWELPLLIKKFNPEYRIFIRHYTEFLYDTICYAV